MLQKTAVLLCATCEARTDRCERGWRARLMPEWSGAVVVHVLCPDCAERLEGDDETAYAD
jgi:hypothetical protein